MFSWGMLEVWLGGMCILVMLLVAITTPNSFLPEVIAAWIVSGIAAVIHGSIYIITARRIKKLEEFKDILMANPNVLKLAEQDQMYPVDSVVTENQEEEAQPDIIAKLNALDPQSRRVVESVIEAESKRSAE